MFEMHTIIGGDDRPSDCDGKATLKLVCAAGENSDEKALALVDARDIVLERPARENDGAVGHPLPV